MKVAENLKKFRKQAGLSQKELADKIGVHQTLIAQFENGLKIPSLAVAVQIADTLEVTVDALCKGSVA